MDRKVRLGGFRKQWVGVQSLELKGCVTIDLARLVTGWKSGSQYELLMKVAYVLIYGQDRNFSIG
jgi:hypothetical protein